MPRLVFTLTAICFLLHAPDSLAGLCENWSTPQKLGNLNTRLIPEASGLVASRKFPGRLYWINDSNNKDRLFYSDRQGGTVQAVDLKGPRFRDTEALALSTCGEEFCLIVADTGNNYRRRKTGVIAVFKESALSGRSARPIRRITIRYPDQPRDVEAVTALPNGDLIFISKEIAAFGNSPASVYRLKSSLWRDADAGEVTVQKIGELPIGDWLQNKKFIEDAVTDAAVNTARGIMGILTYSSVIEIPISNLEDLANVNKWQAGQNYAVVAIKKLTQQETMTYLESPDTLVWSSEAYPPRTPIFGMTCAPMESENAPTD